MTNARFWEIFSSYEAHGVGKVSCLGGSHQKGGKFLDSKSWWNITAPAGL